jgi:hypothetical protein
MAPSRPAGPTDLLLFEKWYDTTNWLMDRTERFPKKVRHTLSDRIDLLAIELLEDLTEAAYRKDPRADLDRANRRLNRLRVLLRLAHGRKLLSFDQFHEGTERMAEAGRLLGGWLRKASRREPDEPSDLPEPS